MQKCPIFNMNGLNEHEVSSLNSNGHEMVSISIPQQSPVDPTVETKGQSSKSCIKKVPDFVRREVHNKGFYDPIVASFGPYHHGKQELKFVEDYKPKVFEFFIEGSAKDADFFYNRVLKAIRRLRSCYAENSTDEYDDASFARMMLYDACFIIIYIQYEMIPTLINHLGKLIYYRCFSDMGLLENQIPFWFIRHLVHLRYGKHEGEEMLKRFLTLSVFDSYEPSEEANQKPEDDTDEPLHLLDAARRVLISNSIKVEETKRWFIFEWFRLQYAKIGSSCQRCCSSKFLWLLKEEETNRSCRREIQSFRSVTSLKAKGIRFAPSPTDYLTDFRFSSSYFYGKLQLPTWIVKAISKTFFLNVVAFEICSGTDIDVQVTNYIYFMKSLIQSANDVKELREKRIIFSELGSDEEVLQMYKDINTYGVEDPDMFYELRKEVQEHYDSKAKTWVAELRYTYFRSPWSAIALLAAMVLLFASLVQSYFAVNPSSEDVKRLG